jgi:hypothetical protein
MFVGVVLLIDASRNGGEIMDLLQKSIYRGMFVRL